MGIVSIIVPTYNERDNVEELIKRIHNSMENIGQKYEVIIVDDNSPDGTAEKAEELSKTYRVKVLRRPGKLGLSSAVLDGLKLAEGDLIVVMDADLQHPPEVIPKLLEKVKERCDIVIASRYVKGGSVEGWGFIRRLMSHGAGYIARLLLPSVRGIKDPMSGFFLFRKDVIKESKLNPRGFKILLEIVVRGKHAKVCEVPYRFGLRHRGVSKLGTGEIINYLIHVLNLSPHYVRFMIVGASGTLVNLGILTLLHYAFGVMHEISSAVGIEASVLSNFLLNDIWTFREERKGSWLNRLLKFHASTAAGIAVQWLTSVGVYHLIIPNSIIAQIIGIILGFIVNYTLSKRYVWEIHKK